MMHHKQAIPMIKDIRVHRIYPLNVVIPGMVTFLVAYLDATEGAKYTVILVNWKAAILILFGILCVSLVIGILYPDVFEAVKSVLRQLHISI